MRVAGGGIALGVAGSHPGLDALLEMAPAVFAVPSLPSSPKDLEEAAQPPGEAPDSAVEANRGFRHLAGPSYTRRRPAIRMLKKRAVQDESRDKKVDDEAGDVHQRGHERS